MKEEEVKNLNMESLENINNGIENFDINNSEALLNTEKEKKSKKNSEDLLGKRKKLKNIKKKDPFGAFVSVTLYVPVSTWIVFVSPLSSVVSVYVSPSAFPETPVSVNFAPFRE